MAYTSVNPSGVHLLKSFEQTSALVDRVGPALLRVQVDDAVFLGAEVLLGGGRIHRPCGAALAGQEGRRGHRAGQRLGLWPGRLGIYRGRGPWAASRQ